MSTVKSNLIKLNSWATDLAKEIAVARGIRDISAKNTAINLKVVRGIIDPAVKNPNWYKNTAAVFKAIEGSPLGTRRTRIKAFLVLSSIRGAEPTRVVYAKAHSKLTTEQAAWLKTQKKSASQAKNWVSIDAITDLRDMLLARALKLDEEEGLEAAEFSQYQKAVAWALYMAYPIRNVLGGLRFMRTGDFDRLEEQKDPSLQNANLMVMDNDASFIYLSKYKTSDRYGIQKISLSPTMHELMRSWRAWNHSDSLFVSRHVGSDEMAPMSEHNFGRLIAAISKKYLKKSVGTTLLRNILISEDNKDRMSIAEEEKANAEIESKYLHSPSQNRLYQKI
jgi:hypothetical protein